MEYILSFIVSNTLNYLFTKGLDKALEPTINKAYESALRAWCKNNIIREKYAKSKFKTITAFENYIKNGERMNDDSIHELCEIFENELKKDTKTYQYIIELKLTGIQENINKTNQKLDEICKTNSQQHNEQNDLLREILCTMNKPRTITATAYSQTDDDCIQYIPRTCSVIGDKKSSIDRYLHPDKYNNKLIDYALGLASCEKNKYVLCGDAQSGKTTELRNMFKELSECDLFNICYKQIKGWNFDLHDISDSEQHDTMIIIDALDECFDDIKRNNLFHCINNYAQHHPFLKMIVSCRSNFKETSYLTEFVKLQLDDLTWNDSVNIIKAKLSNPELFIENIKNKGLYEFTRTPFYLLNLIDYFKDTNALPEKKHQIYDYIISKMLSKEDEKAVAARVNMTTRCRKSLENLAVTLQLTNQNGLSEDFILELVGNDYTELESIKRSGMIKFENDQYTFINNAFKEYLVSNFLLGIKTIDKVKQICCYSNVTLIKSTWYNTIALYLAQLSKGNPMLGDLINWINDDNQDLILYVEPGLIDDHKRFAIFKDIIERYKKMGIIYSRDNMNRFASLMEFGYCQESLEYLNNELSSIFQHNCHTINVLLCISHLNWASTTILHDKLTKSLYASLFRVFELLYADKNNWEVWEPFQNTYLLKDKTTIQRIYSLIKASETQEIINSFLNLIYESGFANDYVDYIIEKSKFVKCYYTTDGIHHNISSIWVYFTLGQVSTKDGIKKVILFVEQGLLNDYHKHDFNIDYSKLIKNILNNAKQVYTFDELSVLLKRVFIICTNPITSDGDLSNILEQLVTYAEEYGKTEYLFNLYLNELATELGNTSQFLRIRHTANMLCCFADEDKLEKVAQQYSDSELGYKIMSYIYQQSYKHRAFIEEKIKQYYPKDHKIAKETSLNKKRTTDLEILFDYSKFKDAVLSLINKNYRKRKDLVKFLKDSEDDNINTYVYYFFEEYANKDGYDFDKIIKQINDENSYKWFLFNQAYIIYESSDSNILSESMKHQVIDIANDYVKKIADGYYTINPNYRYYALDMLMKGYLGNMNSTVLIRLLKYSSYQYYDSTESDTITLFDYISKQKNINKNDIVAFIQSEIKNDRLIPLILKERWTKYIINNAITCCYPAVFQWAKDDNADKTIYTLISNTYTRNIITTKEVLNSFSINNRLIIYTELTELKNYDSSWIKDEIEKDFNILEDGENKKTVIKLLVKLGSLIGLKYINENKDYYLLHDLYLNYNDKDAIPELFKALDYILDNKCLFKAFRFDDLINGIVLSLGCIATQSKETFTEIKHSIDSLIEIDKTKYAFLYYHVLAWESKLLENQTKTLTLQEVITILQDYQ